MTIPFQFSILDQFSELDTVREYYFGVLKLAKYVRFRFDKSSWPQLVQCVRLELIGCQAGEKIRYFCYKQTKEFIMIECLYFTKTPF